MKHIYVIDDKEVTKEEYSAEFERQCVLYGSVINRTSIDKNVFTVGIIDFKKVYPELVRDICTCDARFSGSNETEYKARGCPDCTCDFKSKGK